MEIRDFNNTQVKSPPYYMEKDSTSLAFPVQRIMESPQNNYIIERTYCEILQKNKPQSNSVVGGFTLLIVSGLHIGWGLWRLDFREPWHTFTNYNLIIFIIMSWYVFAICGSLIGAVFVTSMRKKYIYYAGGTLSAVSSVLFIVWYDNYIAIIIGRCIAGLSHGIYYNATITHAAENVIKDIRGMLLSTVNCLIFSGVFISATLIASIRYGYVGAFNSDRIWGMFGLFFSLSGIFSSMFLTYETIPFLLRHNKDAEAVVNMLKLRNESVMTPKLTNDLDEMRLMVAQDKLDNKNIFTDGNGTAASKMIALRILSNLSNNFLLNIILMSITAMIFGPSNYEIAAIVLTGARFCASFIPVFSSDFFRRKAHLTVSGISSGISLLVLSIIMVSVNDFRATYWIPAVAATFCIAFQFFAALGIDPMQHVLTSEAFSTSKKAWSIAYVTAAEYLSQILLIGVYFIEGINFTTIITVLFVTAGLILLITLLLQLTLPETFRTTMKEARDVFRI